MSLFSTLFLVYLRILNHSLGIPELQSIVDWVEAGNTDVPPVCKKLVEIPKPTTKSRPNRPNIPDRPVFPDYEDFSRRGPNYQIP